MSEIDEILGDYAPPTGLEKAAGGLRKFGHTLSMIPILSTIAWAPAGFAALLDTVDGYINKGFGAGTKNFIEGTIDTTVTGVTGIFDNVSGVGWWVPLNWVAGLGTKNSIGEIARQGTEAVLDSFIPDSFSGVKSEAELAREMQVLGPNPMTIGSVPAGMAYAGLPQQPMMQQAPMGQAQINPMTGETMQPGAWADRMAERAGIDPASRRQAWASANPEELAALRNAAQGPREMAV